MDESVIAHNLAQAERHAEEGRAHIARQRELIAKLDNHGLDTSAGEAVLKIFLETQDLHEDDVARLRAQLAGTK